MVPEVKGTYYANILKDKMQQKEMNDTEAINLATALAIVERAKAAVLARNQEERRQSAECSVAAQKTTYKTGPLPRQPVFN